MKTLSIFKSIRPIWMVGAVCVILLGGCQESELDKIDTMPISQIAERDDYDSLSLTGTKWKLIGFVDEKKGEVKLARPSEMDGLSIDSYILVFQQDYKLYGYTSTNTAEGWYSLEDRFMSITGFTHVTKINELFDGPRYIEYMNKVSSFDISVKGLALHYESGRYMLFEPVE